MKTPLRVIPRLISHLACSSARVWLMALMQVGVAVLGPLPAVAAKVLYVAVGGSDTNPGSTRRPFRSLGRAATAAAAGDTVLVRPGTYRESLVLTRSGRAGAPITFRGLGGVVLVSPDASRSLSGIDVREGVGFVTVSGFELTGGYDESVFVRPGAHHVELGDLDVHDNQAGIWIAGAYVTLSDSAVHHNRHSGVRIFAGARKVWVHDTRSEANDDGRGCDGDADGFSVEDSASDVVLERVTAIGNSEDGFDVHQPNAVLLQAWARDNPCSGVKMANGGYLENILVERATLGINVSGVGVSTQILNATVVDSDTGIRAMGNDHALTLRNSIISGPGKALLVGAQIGLTEGSNIFFRPGPRERLLCVSRADGELLYTGDDISSGRWRRESGQGVGSLYRDPYLDPTDARPLPGSVAIDSGDPSAAPPIDLVGTKRPAGAVVDRGAFEVPVMDPDQPVLRAKARPDRRSLGRMFVAVQLRVPFGASSSLSDNRLALAVRCDQRVVARLDVPSSAWQARRRYAASVATTVIASASQHARLRAQVSKGVVRVRLGLRDQGLRACARRPVSLEIGLGGWSAIAKIDESE